MTDGPMPQRRPTSATGRRAFVRASAAGLSVAVLAGRVRHARAAPPAVRLGILQFGTVQWLADIIRRNRLDAAHGVALQTVTLANIDAGRVALMAGSADVVVSDLLFAATQRAAGTRLCFAPFSSAAGALMVRADSPVRTLADLRGKRLGVAGGPTDKSWIVVQAAARARDGIELATAAQLAYAAPPLLNAKLAQGELDAVLTFWNFAARLEAEGFRQAVSVADCARALGLPGELGLVGYVFREDWARTDPAAIDGLLAAATDAEARLSGPDADAEWAAIRPLMNAPDDALARRLRERFTAGIVRIPAASREATAAQVFAVLRDSGGAAATGGLAALPPGLFWRGPGSAG